MATQAERHEFEIQRDTVRWYFLASSTLAIVLIGLFVVVGICLGPLWAVTLGLWVTRRQADALKYWLEGSTLRINEGFIFVKHKSIPLDRVTDVVLAQGPVQRAFGIWQMNIQTAGSGEQLPEGILYGVVDAEAARDGLLAVRDQVTGANRSGA